MKTRALRAALLSLSLSLPCLLLVAPSAAAEISTSFANVGPVASGTFQINPLTHGTITLDYTIDAAGAVSMDASTTSTDTTFINLVNQFDRPNGTAGTTATTAAFNTSFSLTIKPTALANAHPRLSISTLGGGGLGIQGQNSNRVDGLNMATPRVETLQISLTAPSGISLRFKDWSWVNGLGADMRFSTATASQDFTDIATAGTLAFDLAEGPLDLGHGDSLNFGQTPDSSNGATLGGFSFDVIGPDTSNLVVDFSHSGNGIAPSSSFLIANNPATTITLHFAISATGVISLNAATNHTAGTFANIVDEWDHPHLGTAANPALFGKKFSLIGTAPGKVLSLTKHGGGGLGIQGENSNRVDGLNYGANNAISTPETLLWTLNAPPDLAIDLTTWTFLDGAGGDMRVSNGVTHRDFPNMAGSEGTFALQGLRLAHGDYLAFSEIPGIGLTTGAAIGGFSFTVVPHEAPYPPRGSLLCERWHNTPFYSTHDLVSSTRFYNTPDISQNDNPATSKFLYAGGKYFSTRTRGWITIPVTGNYRFWLSARSGAQLLLSEAGDKYTKRVIAELNPELGTGNGIPSNASELWDVYFSQMSGEIHLTAGQTYYLETIQTNGHDKNGHASIAWTRPGLPRTPMDLAFVHPYTPTEDDADDNYLPDAWETSHQIRPTATDPFDLTRHGERGDFDGDGLTNLEEYLLGTHPANPDSDGDGISDYDEIHTYRTDPFLPNTIANVFAASPALHQYQAATGSWSANPDGTLTAADSRGEITYTFTLTEPGVHEITLTGAAVGSIRPVERLPIVFSLNGLPIAHKELISYYGGHSSVRTLTHWLTPGTHTLTILHDNYRSARRLRIDAIDIHRLGGQDINSSGIPDWIEQTILAQNRLTRIPNHSHTSPASIEGITQNLPTTTLTVAGASGSFPISPTASINNSFFTDVPLSPDGPTTLHASFLGGITTEAHSITWTPTNLLDTFPDDTLHIRLGDSLRLTAHDPVEGASGSFIFNVQGASGSFTTQPQPSTQPVTHTFTTPGAHTLTATWTPATGPTQSATLTIIVHSADFGPAHLVQVGIPRDWTPPALAASHLVEADSRVVFNEKPTTGARQFKVFTTEAINRHVIARLPGGIAGAPSAILARGTIHAFDVIRPSQTQDSSIITQYPDGTWLLHNTIIAVNLPPNMIVRITTHNQGAIFTNGSTTLNLNSTHFDANGIAHIYYEWAGTGAPTTCHKVQLFLTP